MARIFTIQFIYDEEPYNVLVSVKTTPFYIEYTLQNLEASLQHLLPGNKFIATSASTYLFPNATAAHSAALMNGIFKAVATHLQAVEH